MSANKPSRKQAVVIACVAVGLVAVAVLNVNTFAGKGGGRRAGADAGLAVAAPAELDGMLIAARADLRGQRGGGGSDTWPELARDPFRMGERAVQPAAPARDPGAIPAPRPKPKPVAGMACTAVFLGGARTVALINGGTYGVGETVRSHKVTGIDTDGITLEKPGGGEIFLPVGPLKEEGTGYRVVTHTSTPADKGETDLVDRPASERSKR